VKTSKYLPTELKPTEIEGFEIDKERYQSGEILFDPACSRKQMGSNL